MSRLGTLTADALGGFAVERSEPSRSRWEATRHGAPVVATLDEAWLLMTAPMTAAIEPCELLERNRALPGLLKFASGENGSVGLRAELPLDEESHPLIVATQSAFESALATLGGKQCVPIEIEPPRSLSQEELRRLCDEAGWSSAPRGGDACVVELETPGAFMPALVAARDGGVRASVQLAGCDAAAADTVSALGIFLLSAAATVRMARPVIETNDGRVLPAFEVIFSAAPTPAQLGHALSALSVACQLCADEAGALRNPDVAREFLALNQTQNRKEPTP